MPVWHVSVSAWSRRQDKSNSPELCEREAIRLLRGVGGDREWWLWNPDALVGLTEAEHDELPAGVAVDDAGDSGPERKRTR